MTIKYQGECVETSSPTVQAFLEGRGVDVAKSLVEYKGEVYALGKGLDALMLEENAELNVFHIVAGG